MGKLTQLGSGLNAYTVRFEDRLLDEIRESYQRDLASFCSNPQNRRFFHGGRAYSEPVQESSHEYFLTSYGSLPLLWLSCNSDASYAIYRRYLDSLGIIDEVKALVDHDTSLVMYCGFFVVCDRAAGYSWHVDYHPGANAYTLITPLFEFDRSHGNLSYRVAQDRFETYRYMLDEAIILGSGFLHSTEPFPIADRMRVLVSLTFGTDKLAHWNVLKRTIGSQSKYMVLPCGHRAGTCQCLDAFGSGSGQKYKNCHGKL